ncbi:alpha/beta fold hydrolase [Niveispirillum irakense]|uniref:alpha/beta fold hydrolase n=1 Tax=Niveispirillum irakense TaxID=34011 RepID=UPI003CCBB7A9
MAAVAADVIRGLGLAPVDLLGWSLGGVVAQQWALDFPHLVRRLHGAGQGYLILAGCAAPGARRQADPLSRCRPRLPVSGD